MVLPSSLKFYTVSTCDKKNVFVLKIALKIALITHNNIQMMLNM